MGISGLLQFEERRHTQLMKLVESQQRVFADLIAHVDKYVLGQIELRRHLESQNKNTAAQNRYINTLQQLLSKIRRLDAADTQLQRRNAIVERINISEQLYQLESQLKVLMNDPPVGRWDDTDGDSDSSYPSGGDDDDDNNPPSDGDDGDGDDGDNPPGDGDDEIVTNDNVGDCIIRKMYCGNKNTIPADTWETRYSRMGTRYECLRKGFGVGNSKERTKNLPRNSLQTITYVGPVYENNFQQQGINNTDELVRRMSSRQLSVRQKKDILNAGCLKDNNVIDQKAFNSIIFWLWNKNVPNLPMCTIINE